MSEKLYIKYTELRDEIDSECGKLWKTHKSQMKCAAGCSSCCQAFRILPIEFHFIKSRIENKSIHINTNAAQGECVFLVDHKCSIYEYRPVICRTHGYPLVRLNEETEAYEISFCQLNFTKFKLDKFNSDNVFHEDVYNSKLYMLNKKFIEEFSDISYDSLQLVELNDVVVNKV